ncbi:MAG: hypothetical protein WC314_07765 [Vulcanimicrobiota bacterium]
MFEIELDRQVIQAGDEILGWVTVQDEDVETVEVAFQGEEILGANDISHSLVLPVADEKLRIDAMGDLYRHEFRFKVPEDAPPSYASRDVRCQYSVKATMKRGFLRRSMIRKLHLTVLPALPEGLVAMPEELEVEHDNLRLIARLDQNVVLSGDALTGTLHFDTKSDSAQLPTRMSFRFASIEESTSRAYTHRHVLSLDTHDIDVDQNLKLPFTGFFEFPLHEHAEPSGTWNLFKVHYGFRVTFYDQNGKDHRASTTVRVVRDLGPWVGRGPTPQEE